MASPGTCAVTTEALGTGHDPRGMIVDPHHHLWVHPTNPYMAPELHADTSTVPGLTKTVFVECGSGYRSDGPEAFRPVGETEFVVAADPTGFVAGIVGFADLTAARGRRRPRRARRRRAGPLPRHPPRQRPRPEPGHPRVAHQAAARPARTGRLPGRVRRPRRGRAVVRRLDVPPPAPRAGRPVPRRARHAGDPRPPRRPARHRPVRRAARRGPRRLAGVDDRRGGVRQRRAQARRHRHGDLRDALAQGGRRRPPEQLAEAWGEPIRWCIETFGAAALHVRVATSRSTRCRARTPTCGGRSS